MPASLASERGAGAAPSARLSRREEILETAARLFGAAGFRTSLQEIAEACGILPGSLYHHFVSKDDLILELVRFYGRDLDRVASRAMERLEADARTPIPAQIEDLAAAIAQCGAANRAALLQTFYEPPANSSPALVDMARHTPEAIQRAMAAILDRGRARGAIRHAVDADLVAEQICQSMLHTGAAGLDPAVGGSFVPALKCRILLKGLARHGAEVDALDGSRALQAADAAIAGWTCEPAAGRGEALQSVATREFGRRGFEATTMRDIALAAGYSTGTVYRLVGAKEKLLDAILDGYIARIAASWAAVLSATATPLEKIDAIAWVNVNILERFGPEFRIHLEWLRSASGNGYGGAKPAKFRPLHLLKDVLSDGERTGGIKLMGENIYTRINSVFELSWVSETIVRREGAKGAHALLRETLFRGAAAPPTSVKA